jgi:uncharacterized membrane protein
VTTASNLSPLSPAAQRPGRDRLWIAILVFAVIGTLIAAYLTYVHYRGFQSLICVGAHNGRSSCETVQSSIYSRVLGIPVALIGLIGYLVILATLLTRIPGELARAVAFLASLIGFGFSVYLSYREVFTLHEICEWCVASAVCLTVLTVLTGIRFLRGPEPRRADSPNP